MFNLTVSVPWQEPLAFVLYVVLFSSVHVSEFSVTFILSSFRDQLKTASECGFFTLCWRSTGGLLVFNALRSEFCLFRVFTVSILNYSVPLQCLIMVKNCLFKQMFENFKTLLFEWHSKSGICSFDGLSLLTYSPFTY